MTRYTIHQYDIAVYGIFIASAGSEEKAGDNRASRYLKKVYPISLFEMRIDLFKGTVVSQPSKG